MAEAIYRKYRPMTFADVTGQEHVKTTVQNQIREDSVAHAYLFSGPRGVGKTTIARLLAKTLNCTNKKDGEPCNECSSCVQMNSGSALDIVEIDAASHTGVDNVRDNIIESVRFAPTQGSYKVFIIDEVHMLSTSAFNALLKTLEEPPAHAIFILATTEIHKIPQTILSRCQRFNFHRIPATEMTSRLTEIAKEEGVTVQDDLLKGIARLSEGCLRDAESLFGQLLALGEKDITSDVAELILPKTHINTAVDISKNLYANNPGAAIDALNAFVHEGGSVRSLQDELIDLVRAVMMTSLNPEYASPYDETVMAEMKSWIKSNTPEKHAQLLDVLLEVRQKPAHESIPQLPLEIAFVLFGKSEVTAASTPPTPPQTPQEPVKQSSPGFDQPEGKEVEKKEEKEEVVQEKKEKAPVEKRVPTDSFIEEVQEKWGRCCAEIKKVSIALPLALQRATPLSLAEGELKIGFDTKFHFENVSQIKNIKIIQDAINEVMQTDIKIKPIYTQEEQDRVVGQLVDAFGGQVV